MRIPVIIMAGGKSNRFDFDKTQLKYREKLLLPLGGKLIVEYVIKAVLNAKNIERIIFAVSPFTPNTKSLVLANKEPLELIDTPGKNYHSDLKFVVKSLNLGIVMTIAADIPLIRPEILDEIIEKYFSLKKPALTVMTEANLLIEHNLTPTIKFQLDKQKSLVPLGINIIDGRLIDQSEIEQSILISKWIELIYNVNTINDYFQLKKKIKK